MNIKKVINYIKDDDFKIVYQNNMVNIINYDSILEINTKEIRIKVKEKIITINGENLSLNKLLEHEILVSGQIKRIDL